MTIHYLIFTAIQHCQADRTLRYGQSLMNTLWRIRPDLAEKINGTDMDIFYMIGPADNPAKWDSFFEFITKNWHQNP